MKIDINQTILIIIKNKTTFLLKRNIRNICLPVNIKAKVMMNKETNILNNWQTQIKLETIKIITSKMIEICVVFPNRIIKILDKKKKNSNNKIITSKVGKIK